MKENITIDLLKECEYGGCSAKVDPSELSNLLGSIPLPTSSDLLVGTSTHDDAGVYKLNDQQALIFTTDFFPPMVADPYTFGRIAATNALSDIYAMGGTPLLSLNLMHYPSTRLPLKGLKEILLGGQSAINESGALTVGGHTIEDHTPQYGIAVVGIVHPNRLITNSEAKAGELLILTKPLGVGTLIAGHRLTLTREKDYLEAIHSMSQLNKGGMEAMQMYSIKGATDVTGFGLLGHGLEMAMGSNVTIEIHSNTVPVLPGVFDLLNQGCIPGAVFRNLRYVDSHIERHPNPNINYLLADPQTSGGLLISTPPEAAKKMLGTLHNLDYPYASIIGTIQEHKVGSPYIHIR